MSNGTGQSKAPYIIICSGEIDVLAAGSQSVSVLKVKAASDAARNLVSYYGDRLTAEDTQPISHLQHTMMEALPSVKKAAAEMMVSEMFDLLHALEDRLS